MEGVIRSLMPHIQKNKQSRGEPEGESEGINDRVATLLTHIPQRQKKIIQKHTPDIVMLLMIASYHPLQTLLFVHKLQTGNSFVRMNEPFQKLRHRKRNLVVEVSNLS